MRPGGDNSAYGPNAQPKPDGTFILSHIAPDRYTVDARPASGEGYVKSILLGSDEVYGKEVDASAVAAAGLKIVIRLDCAAVNGTVEIPEERKAVLRSPSVVLLPTEVHPRDSGQRHIALLNQTSTWTASRRR
jgi:hypothetical protein